MAIYFSEKFKQNRKARDLTQEQLAEIFHVSPQAISRWEIGATCPDIELLPSIASYFKITVDELLGVDKIRDKARIEEIDTEIRDKMAHGHIDDALEIARNAIREFPHEYKFQWLLSVSLSLKIESDKENEKNNHEAIAILERVLENSTDDDTRNQALYSLSQRYQKAGNKEKAVEMAKKLAYASGSRDIVLEQIYEGDELREHLKGNIANFTATLTRSIYQLAYSMYNLGSYERIKLLNKAIGIYDFIYENGDYGFGNFTLSLYYYELAENYYEVYAIDPALCCLEKAAQHAVDFDTLTDFKQHTSLAVQGLEKTGELWTNTHTNQCHTMLHRRLPHSFLPHGNEPIIKDDERFKAVVAKLEKHAKSE